MKIYRIAAMFKTFGLEDKLINSFNRHFNEVRNALEYPEGRRDYKRVFDKNGSLYIGASNVRKFLEPIIEHYGEPKFMPTRIDFWIISKDDKTLPVGDAKGIFFTGEDQTLNIGSVVPDFKSIKTLDPKQLKGILEHEIQHFIKKLYVGWETRHMQEELEEAEDQMEYYSDDWEIQAYAMNIAKSAIGLIKLPFNYRIKGKSPSEIERIKGAMSSRRQEVIAAYLIPDVKKFFGRIEGGKGAKLSPEVRKAYYQAALRDFNTLFDEMLASV